MCWHGGLEKCGPNMGLQLGHLEFFHLGILTHCVLSPWGLGVCVVVECVTPGSQVITLSIQGAACEGGQLYESQHTVA